MEAVTNSELYKAGLKGGGAVFSGEASKPLWDEINAIDALSTGDDIREVLYSFGCAMQELEAKLKTNQAAK